MGLLQRTARGARPEARETNVYIKEYIIRHDVMGSCGWVSCRGPKKAARFRMSCLWGVPTPEGHQISQAAIRTIQSTRHCSSLPLDDSAGCPPYGCWRNGLAHSSVTQGFPFPLYKPFFQSVSRSSTELQFSECTSIVTFSRVPKQPSYPLPRAKVSSSQGVFHCWQGPKSTSGYSVQGGLFVLLVSMFSPQAKTRWKRMATQFQLRRRI